SEARTGQQLAGIVSDEVAEQAERCRLGDAIGLPERLYTAGAPASLEMQHGDSMAEEDRRDRRRKRREPDEQHGRRAEGDHDADAPQGPNTALAAQAALTRAPPPRHGGGLGKYSFHP